MAIPNQYTNGQPVVQNNSGTSMGYQFGSGPPLYTTTYFNRAFRKTELPMTTFTRLELDLRPRFDLNINAIRVPGMQPRITPINPRQNHILVVSTDDSIYPVDRLLLPNVHPALFGVRNPGQPVPLPPPLSPFQPKLRQHFQGGIAYYYSKYKCRIEDLESFQIRRTDRIAFVRTDTINGYINRYVDLGGLFKADFFPDRGLPASSSLLERAATILTYSAGNPVPLGAGNLLNVYNAGIGPALSVLKPYFYVVESVSFQGSERTFIFTHSMLLPGLNLRVIPLVLRLGLLPQPSHHLTYLAYG